MAVAVDRSKVKAFKVSPKAAGNGSGATPITMSIDAVDSPRVTMRAKTENASAASTSFAVDKRGTLAVAAAEGSDPKVNIANGLNSVDFSLPDGIDMTVDPDAGDGIADIEYVDEDGNVVGEYSIDDETEDGSVVDGTADFDAESGEFDVTEEEAEAVDVDEDVLAWLGDDSSGDSGDESADEYATDDSGSSDSESDSGEESGSDSGGDSATGEDSGGDSGAGEDSGGDSGAGEDSGGDSGADEDTGE
ncbi:MAG: hypothetical protein F2836_04535 [Actinobacteria bacterium]|uniref:Unannotated protein n=1 Tax=freshwater metagenome TaxID=449393 RepID=A0A6J7IX01_9ZZZZ|nr:hypothetical protein [Actinomycetota bacterium]